MRVRVPRLSSSSDLFNANNTAGTRWLLSPVKVKVESSPADVSDKIKTKTAKARLGERSRQQKKSTSSTVGSVPATSTMVSYDDYEDGGGGGSGPDYADGDYRLYYPKPPLPSTVSPKLLTTIVTNCFNATTIDSGDGENVGGGVGDGGPIYNGEATGLDDRLNGGAGTILGGITGTYYYNSTTMCNGGEQTGPDDSVFDESNFVQGYIFIGLILGLVILATIIGE